MRLLICQPYVLYKIIRIEENLRLKLTLCHAKKNDLMEHVFLILIGVHLEISLIHIYGFSVQFIFV